MVSHPRKFFYPLESNPDVFNELIRLLGVSPRLAFEDVLSLDAPEESPGPPPSHSPEALALVLAFPADDVLATEYAAAGREADRYADSGDGEPTVWFRQTIGNACGLYAVLHGVCNGRARGFAGKNTDFFLGNNRMSKKE